MKLYYRISDKSYEKPKLAGATKEVCLMNFLSVFNVPIFQKDDCNLTIVADRCERKTMKMLNETGLKIVMTDKGNAGSFLAALEIALENNDDEFVYFCEDDYLHKHNSYELLNEIYKRVDYVTLYDHPDKYTRYYNGGEHSKVIKTNSSHWRFTASTCMTFGAKVKTLREDKEVWHAHTNNNHPWDHKIFTDLAKKNRKLAVSIPGAACHTDLTFSGMIGKTLIEPWAIEMMISRLEDEIKLMSPDISDLKSNKTGWDKLILLDAIMFDLKKKAVV